MLEIIVSLMILSLVLLGLANIFSVSKQFVLRSRSKVSAAEIVRVFLEANDSFSVREDYRAANSTCLYNFSLCQDNTVTLDNKVYTGHYVNVSDVAGTNLRRVVLNVTWNETTLNP